MPELGRASVSLRSILIAIVVTATIPTLIFSGILLQRYAASERERSEAELEESARGLARAVDAELAGIRAVLLALASSPRLAEGDLADFEEQLRAVRIRTGRHLELLDLNGEVVASTQVPPGSSPLKLGPGDWKTAVEARRTYVTHVLQEPDGRLLARVVVPIVQDDAVRWALHAIVLPSDFSPILRQPGVPSDWIVSVVDQDGTHFIRSHGNDKFAGRPLVPVLVDRMKRRETGTLPTISLEGISLISTVAYAPSSQWAVAVGLPEATLQSPLYRQLRDLAILGAVLLATAFILAFLTARYLDTSIQALRRAARRVGSGATVDPPPTRVREVQHLADVLSQISHQLHDRTTRLAELNATLEEQVAARTAQLTESNTKLLAEMKRREETEEQLRQIQKLEAVGQLTGGLAHDFNNMLAVAMSSLRLIARRLERGDTRVQELIDGGLQSVERAATLTRRLLAFARQQSLAPKEVNVNRLLADMEDMLRRTLREDIIIETRLAGGVWRTYVDVSGLENAIINLAANARDAMASGGKLTMETANARLDEAYAAEHAEVSAGDYVMIAVTDTGCGMTPQVAHRAFDPFFTTKPVGQGTGLGLSQVFGFLKQSGGHVTIYSEVGSGTTIKLYLPRLLDQADRPTGTAPTQFSTRTIGSKELVLVVEDNHSVREVTVQLLHELNYATIDADCAQTALALLDSHPNVKVLLTDVVMPDMNGRKLAEEALKRRPDLKVLYTTGYTRSAIVHNGVLDPDVQLLVKPFTIEDLAQKLDEILSTGVMHQTGS
jgi:signal transduction histidine kinase/ActR/RegA family two-component response regulator